MMKSEDGRSAEDEAAKARRNRGKRALGRQMDRVVGMDVEFRLWPTQRQVGDPADAQTLPDAGRRAERGRIARPEVELRARTILTLTLAQSSHLRDRLLEVMPERRGDP